jgi:hypothetical protein
MTLDVHDWGVKYCGECNVERRMEGQAVQGSLGA